MTRYARANKCQKRKPEEATPWKEMATAGSSQGETNKSAKRKSDQSEAPQSAKRKRQQGRNFRGKKSSRNDANDSNGWNQHRASLAQKTDGADTEATSAGGDATGGVAKRQKLDVSRNRELRFGGDFGSKFDDAPRQSNAKVCFNCRQRGHMLVDCPTAQARDKGRLCFKCGSTDHDIKQCPVTTNDMPFATCFVCKNRGHLSRNCPDNAKGVYPRGGECRGCGSTAHLYTHCPTSKKNTDPESMPYYVERMSSVQGSVDLEPIGPKKKGPVKPQAKIVTF